MLRRILAILLLTISLVITCPTYQTSQHINNQHNDILNNKSIFFTNNINNKRTLLYNGPAGLGPRAIVLSHQPNPKNNGLILLQITPNVTGSIFTSYDNGVSFQQVGAVSYRTEHVLGVSSGIIFELPTKLGAMPAGTILWAGPVKLNPNRRMRIDMWQSSDLGHSWKFVSSLATATDVKQTSTGLWEPELNIAKDGDLVCHFSDETLRDQHSQVLQEVFTKDGITWSQRNPTVALTAQHFRPGMANVRQLSDSLWVMTYELCASNDRYDCGATIRTSTDGKNWGNPTDHGTLVQDDKKRYFAHSPTLAFSPQTGVLVMAAKILNSANGAVDKSGLIFQTDKSLKEWKAVAAPVLVDDVQNKECPNYSPGMAFLNDGTKLFEVSTDWDKNVCKAYCGTKDM